MLGLGGNQAPMNNGAFNLGVRNVQGQAIMQTPTLWGNQLIIGTGQTPRMKGILCGQQ